MTVSDDTIQAEGLCDFLKKKGKKGLNISKKMAKNISKNPGRALDFTANIAAAAASENLKQALSTLPELIIFIKLQNCKTWVNLYNLCYIIGAKSTKTIPICFIRKY